jgi:hypothetical protein
LPRVGQVLGGAQQQGVAAIDGGHDEDGLAGVGGVEHGTQRDRGIGGTRETDRRSDGRLFTLDEPLRA